MKTNNPLERIIREIRRRTRVVGAFPDGHSALMLVAARLRHIASTKWGKRRYLAMETLLNPLPEEAAALEPTEPPPKKVRKIRCTTPSRGVRSIVHESFQVFAKLLFQFGVF